jgi:transposase-like protein
MVKAVRGGESIRAVARRFGVSVPTVQRWVERVSGQRLDRASFADGSKAPKRVANRTDPEMEQRVLSVRTFLKEQSALGEFGAAAIRHELQRRHLSVTMVKVIELPT